VFVNVTSWLTSIRHPIIFQSGGQMVGWSVNWYYVSWDTLHFVWYSVDRVKLSTVRNKFAAPTKLVLQSLWICSIGPRREMNRQRAIRNVSVEKSEANFRCRAFVAMQTNRQMYAWHGIVWRVVDIFRIIGPA